MLPNFSYVRVGSLEDVIAGLSAKGVRLLAGGTDLLGCLRDGVLTADTVLSLTRIDALKGIAETADAGLRIGALTTITQVAEHPQVRQRYPGLAQAALAVGSPQLRNQGTLGGNLCQKPRCWYYRGEFVCRRKGGKQCFAFDGENQFHAIFGSDDLCCYVHPSDTAAALVALNAAVRVAGSSGTKTVPMEKFFVGPGESLTKETALDPGEVVTDIVLPPPGPSQRSSYRKVRVRGSWDFAVAGVALSLGFKGETMERARVVLSGAAPVPWRAADAEQVLVGAKLDAATVTKAADAAVKGAKPLQQNGYKVPLFRGVIEEALTTIAKAR